MKSFFYLLVLVTVFGGFDVCQGEERDGPKKGEGLLQIRFYQDSCPQAERIVRNITWKNSAVNPVLGAKLLRLHFHDCFVGGCDGSVLLDSTNTSQSEKEIIPNLSLAGFDVIDEIKAQLEQECPGLVSCADIVALATRDAVSFRLRRDMWPVFTGRRDGRVSFASEVLANLPPPFADFSLLTTMFAAKNLTVTDLVVLSGAHTIGRAHCFFITNRLYNFTGHGDVDPTLDPRYADFLRKQCPNPPNPQTTVEMDPFGSLDFDNHYYTLLKQRRGLFQSDAALLTNVDAANMVNKLQNPVQFLFQFAKSMVKMGAIEVLTGNQGEIRKNCHVVN